VLIRRTAAHRLVPRLTLRGRARIRSAVYIDRYVVALTQFRKRGIFRIHHKRKPPLTPPYMAATSLDKRIRHTWEPCTSGSGGSSNSAATTDHLHRGRARIQSKALGGGGKNLFFNKNTIIIIKYYTLFLI